jgi:hypothetical protein
MRRTHLITFVALLVTLAVSWSALAQSDSDYDLTWNTSDNGGGTRSNGGYTLDGTIGQPDASNAASNADYTLSGGFWFSAAALQQRIYLPLVLKSA